MGKKAAGESSGGGQKQSGAAKGQASGGTKGKGAGGGELKIVAGLVVVAAVVIAFFSISAPDAAGGVAAPVGSKDGAGASAGASAAAKSGAAASEARPKVAAGVDSAMQMAQEAEKQARVKLTQGDNMGAKPLFEKAISLAQGSSATSHPDVSDIVPSAHMHVGTIFGEMKLFEDCARHHEVARRDPRVLSGALLRDRSWPFDNSILPYLVRMHTGSYKHCLHALRRDDDAREAFKEALANNIWRADWQCTSGLSSEGWNLRTHGWWDLADAAKGAGEMTDKLFKYKKKIRKESDNFFNKGIAPPGVRGVPLNEEQHVNGTKTWLELILYRQNKWQDLACSAVPNICKVLRGFQKHFHPSGQVKLSAMTGGTRATRHCGPCDTKLRLHHAILLPEANLAEIIVGGETKHWEEGRSLLFDDSFEHTVNFEADPEAKRVVLIADFIHPDVPKEAIPDLKCR